MFNQYQNVALSFHEADNMIIAFVIQGLFACFAHDFESAAEWFDMALQEGLEYGYGSAVMTAALLMAYAKEETGSDLEGAINAIGLAQSLAESTNSEDAEFQLNFWRGRLHASKGEPKLASDFFNKAADAALLKGDVTRATQFRKFAEENADLKLS